MSFGSNKITRKKSEKGDYSEYIVSNIYSGEYSILKPEGDKSHEFDGIALNENDIFLFDVKSKAARNYHKDTGIDFRHFKKYILYTKKLNLPFYLIFVDEELGYVYRLLLNKYYDFNKDKIKIIKDTNETIYPIIENKYIYFSLEEMEKIYKLKIEERKILRNYSKNTNKHYKFDPIWKNEKIFKKI